MFHSFQTTSVAIRSPGQGEENKRPAGRRISTSNACVECRRRKIRCDGLQPCGQCQWYQHPEACNYAKPAQRVVPSRKLVEKLQSSIEQHQMVLARMFGGKDLDALVSLPREELLNLALSQPTACSPSVSHSQQLLRIAPSRSQDTHSLEALEEPPDPESDCDDFDLPERLKKGSEETTAMGSKVDRQSSYIGVSSVNAAVKVIFRVAPMARRFLKGQSTEVALPTAPTTPGSGPFDATAMPPVEEGIKLVDQFFDRAHPFVPMLDEQTIRSTYLSNTRTDTSWRALINMVFALGSLVAATADDMSHTVYYNRARLHTLPQMETFGNPDVEMLQALIMMSGIYMHFMNRSNAADALMGATLRAACALGIHREYVASKPPDPATSSSEQIAARARGAVPADVRRRTWWSMFCLDTWATTTTGRPSLGRLSTGVTVREPGSGPENSADPNDVENLKFLPLIHNTAFCKMATRIQDKLCASPQIPYDEVAQLDSELVRWWDDLPTMLTVDKDDSIPPFLLVPRKIMKWRYHNLRIMLHRPYLLSAALRGARIADLSGEEKLAVGKCRVIAAATIDSIASECQEDLVSGWIGVWLAYQAAFVPLVSLFTDTSIPEETEKWRTTVGTAIAFFARIKSYSMNAERSKQVVSKLLEAARTVAETADARRRQEQAMKAVMAQRDREAQHLRQRHRRAQTSYIGPSTPTNVNVPRHSPSHSHASLDQLAPANMTHPALGLPLGANPVHLGLGNIPPVAGGPGLMEATAVWQEPLHPNAMTMGAPNMLHGGAFWDEMMWDTFTPVAENPPHNPFAPEGYMASPTSGNWSPNAGDIPQNHNHSWGEYQPGQGM